MTYSVDKVLEVGPSPSFAGHASGPRYITTISIIANSLKPFSLKVHIYIYIYIYTRIYDLYMNDYEV